MHDEPLEDSVDWPRLRQIRTLRIEWHVVHERELQFGIPPRLDRLAVWADGSRHSEARRGRAE